MSIQSEFPTTSSALEELKDGDYDIVQLSKKVDEALKALDDSQEGAASTGGNKDNGKGKSRKATVGEYLELSDRI